MRFLTDASGRTSAASRAAFCGALTALALMFSYVEFLFPLPLGVPGIKPGFANIVVLVALFAAGERCALAVNCARILLSALLFGSVFSALYSLAGGLVSFAAMVLLKKAGPFSVTGISVAAGALHNMAQLAVAAFIVETARVFFYIPVLLLSGMVTGALTGMLSVLILRALRAR